MDKPGKCAVKMKQCGICGEESSDFFFITSDGSQYNDLKMCLLYEVLCTGQGFFLCVSCDSLVSSTARKVAEVCRTRKCCNVTRNRGCFLCGLDHNTRVFKTMNKELDEKVLRRFKRQHQFKTTYTDTICNNCKVMFTDLVKLHTLLHDNIENYGVKTSKKHPALKLKKIQPVEAEIASTSHDDQFSTFSEAKKAQTSAVAMGLPKKVTFPLVQQKPSHKLPPSKILLQSIPNLEGGTSRKMPDAAHDDPGRCSGDFDITSRKRVSFQKPLVSTSSSSKPTGTTPKSILKEKTFETYVPCKGIRIPIDFSKIKAPQLLKLIKTTHRSPRFYNETDLPPRRYGETRTNVSENYPSSQPSLLDVGTQVASDLSDDGEGAWAFPTLPVTTDGQEKADSHKNLSTIFEEDDEIEVEDKSTSLTGTNNETVERATLSIIVEEDEDLELEDKTISLTATNNETVKRATLSIILEEDEDLEVEDKTLSLTETDNVTVEQANSTIIFEEGEDISIDYETTFLTGTNNATVEQANSTIIFEEGEDISIDYETTSLTGTKNVTGEQFNLSIFSEGNRHEDTNLSLTTEINEEMVDNVTAERKTRSLKMVEDLVMAQIAALTEGDEQNEAGVDEVIDSPIAESITFTFPSTSGVDEQIIVVDKALAIKTIEKIADDLIAEQLMSTFLDADELNEPGLVSKIIQDILENAVTKDVTGNGTNLPNTVFGESSGGEIDHNLHSEDFVEKDQEEVDDYSDLDSN